MVLTFESAKEAQSFAEVAESVMAQGAEILMAVLVACICLSLLWVQFKRPNDIWLCAQSETTRTERHASERSLCI